ncbi:MAG: NUDIX hydrolase [Candidatus Nanohalobium sp.]
MSSFYAAAAAIVENEDGEILMVQESKDHIHEKWDLPGGGWEDEESVIDCVKREVLEETGYRIDVTGFLGVYKGESMEDSTEVIVFMFTGKPAEQKTEELEEDILQKKWFTPEEIPELDLRKDNRREMIERYQKEEPDSLGLLWNNLNLLE